MCDPEETRQTEAIPEVRANGEGYMEKCVCVCVETVSLSGLGLVK